MFTKTAVRQSLQHITADPGCYGRLAQYLRQIKSYHGARQLFISPAPMLAQLRINALNDGKDVIVPSPGLKDGFYLLQPFTVPFTKLPFAVSNRGLPQFGRRLTAGDLAALALDLLITDAWAVDEQGARLGDGLGFFDLSYAIMAKYKALKDSCLCYAVLDTPERLLSGTALPTNDWDVKMDGVILPSGIRAIPGAMERSHPIYWDKLPRKRIKKLKPLWEIWRDLN